VAGLLTITGSAVVAGTTYDVFVASSAGVAPGDHLAAELVTPAGEDAIYRVLSVPNVNTVRVEDDLLEAHVTPFGLPAAGAGAFGTPGTGLGLSFLPEGARGWRALNERDNAILDSHQLEHLATGSIPILGIMDARAIGDRLRETGGPTVLAMGGVADTEFLARSGASVVGVLPSALPVNPHAPTHENGGADEINVAGLSGLLADGQTPLAHAATHENGGADEISVLGLSGLLADGQTPLAHAASHENGGADEINVAGLSGQLADDQLPVQATEILKGGGEIATQVETDAGASDTVLVTPLKLASTTLPFTPAMHAVTHENGGADEISVAGLGGLLATAQTPILHAATHENGGADEISVLGLSGLLADGQTPLAHAASHQNGGTDELNVAGLNGQLADDQPPLQATEILVGGGEVATQAETDAGVDDLRIVTPLKLANFAGLNGSLQDAYNNSVSPHVVLDAVGGGLVVRDNPAPLGVSLFAVQSNAGVALLDVLLTGCTGRAVVASTGGTVAVASAVRAAGAAVIGDGVAVDWVLTNAAGAEVTALRFATEWSSAVAGAETSEAVFSARVLGVFTEALRFRNVGLNTAIVAPLGITLNPNGDVNDGLELVTIANNTYVLPLDPTRAFYFGNTSADPTIDLDRGNSRCMNLVPLGTTLTSGTPSEWVNFGSTVIVNYTPSSVGGLVSATGTFQFNQAGSAFGAGNLFKNAAIFKNQNGVAAGFGAQYTFVNTAVYQADGAAISSLFWRNCLFQPTWNRINAGTLAITTCNPGGFINPTVGAGVTITDMRHWEWTAGVYTGTVTNNDLLYFPNVTGGTNFSAIRSLIAAGATRFFINHTGTAASNFAGTINLTGASRLNFAVLAALGGGAAATLGTIGGAGPTAAAQATWVPVQIAGVVHWIPAWT